MTHFHRSFARSASLLALTSWLAACGSQSSITAPDSAALVPVNLATDSLARLKGAALQPQGVPFNDDGSSAVKSVHVQVFNTYTSGGSKTPLRFDELGNEDANGTRDYIELTPPINVLNPTAKNLSTAQLRLRPGSYQFEATGLTMNSGGVALAYQLLRDVQIDSKGGNFTKDNPLLLHLSTIIGQASLEPVVPVTYVYPGQILDLNLIVQTPEVEGGKRYTVPLSDFDLDPTGRVPAAPQPNVGVEVLTSSKIGSRIRIKSPGLDQTEVVYRVVVGSYGTNPGRPIITYATFSRPLYAPTTLGVDLIRPELFISVSGKPGPGRGASLFVQAYDGALAGVYIYDGYDLVLALGSDIPANQGYQYVFGDTQREHVFTVVAMDFSGNETRETIKAGPFPF